MTVWLNGLARAHSIRTVNGSMIGSEVVIKTRDALVCLLARRTNGGEDLAALHPLLFLFCSKPFLYAKSEISACVCSGHTYQNIPLRA